jgi:hypothetical protein
MDPVGYIIGVGLTRDLAQSALPGAPVVPDRRMRSSRPPRHRAGLRKNTASALRSVATWIEPKPRPECITH